MLARLHVIVSSEKDEDIETVKQRLLQIDSEFSISAAREYQGLKGHSEFYCTFKIHENKIQSLLDKLNNDWEGEREECDCYGFNTKMFHELVYYLEFILFD